jgi:hypothetical protein
VLSEEDGGGECRGSSVGRGAKFARVVDTGGKGAGLDGIEFGIAVVVEDSLAGGGSDSSEPTKDLRESLLAFTRCNLSSSACDRDGEALLGTGVDF